MVRISRLSCTALLSSLLSWPLAAAAAPPDDEASGPEVTEARHGQLPSLRGVMRRPGPVNPSEGVRPLRPFPVVDGPGQPDDTVVQSVVGASAPAALGSIDGLGRGFSWTRWPTV
jgi:hypothetical protein